MRVLVVDDSAFMRKAITTMLGEDSSIDVIGTARNGREAVEMAERLQPDVITLDIEMPEMDGLTALRKIMQRCPTQVIMVSSLTTEGSHATLTALKLGAADFLAKDQSQVSLAVVNLRDELLTKVKALGASSTARRLRPAPIREAAHAPPSFRPGQFDLICIGSSTGGPPVLENVLPEAPANISAPIIVAQHMPEVFTRSMAERLADMCKVPVVHAENGQDVEPRTIYVAPGGRNVHVEKVGLTKRRLLVNDKPAGAIYRPSVDALFASAAKAVGARCLAIVFTGIGEDGKQGAGMLVNAGGTVLAQSEETCVVYGMPKAVTQAGLAKASLSPQQIAKVLVGLSQGAAPTRKAG